MADPVPFDSVASLLEQILAAIQAQTPILQETLQNAQQTNTTLASILDAQNATNSLLTASNATLEDIESFTEEILTTTQDILTTAEENLEVSQLLLESSHRIEQLLGGTGPAVPSAMKVSYKFTLKE